MAFYAPTDCLICEGSALLFRLASNGRTLVLYCPECSTVWLDPAQLSPEQARFPQFEQRWLIPGTEVGIKGKRARWATRDEIVQKGWGYLIAGACEEKEF